MSDPSLPGEDSGPTAMKKQDKCPIPRRREKILDLPPQEPRKNVQKASEEARKWTYRHEKVG